MYTQDTRGISYTGAQAPVAASEARTRAIHRSGDRRLMMPKQISSQPIADSPPGPGAPPAIISTALFRREPFANAWSQRAERSRAASHRGSSQPGKVNRSSGYGRNRRQSSRKAAQR